MRDTKLSKPRHGGWEPCQQCRKGTRRQQQGCWLVIAEAESSVVLQAWAPEAHGGHVDAGV